MHPSKTRLGQRMAFAARSGRAFLHHGQTTEPEMLTTEQLIHTVKTHAATIRDMADSLAVDPTDRAAEGKLTRLATSAVKLNAAANELRQRALGVGQPTPRP